eukprot:scaffold5081_cov430-Prasinococcus_capsulatus_cf.AAC.2
MRTLAQESLLHIIQACVYFQNALLCLALSPNVSQLLVLLKGAAVAALKELVHIRPLLVFDQRSPLQARKARARCPITMLRNNNDNPLAR